MAAPSAANASSADWFRVWVEDEVGVRTLLYQRTATAAARGATFLKVRRSLLPWADQPVRIVIGAGDEGGDSLVEVAVDDLYVER